MSNLENSYTGLGKRKCAVAKIFLTEGSGTITVNGKSFDKFFSGASIESEMIKNPLILLNLTDKYDINVRISGGGVTAQLEAIKLGIAKAMCQIDNNYREILNQHFLLTRDSRIKERRKYGLKKARKASQYSKR